MKQLFDQRHQRLALQCLLWIGVATLTTAAKASVDQLTSFSNERRQVVVSYSDLDIYSPQDAKRLYSRIRSAARGACSQHSRRSLIVATLESSCERDAVERAVELLASPLVTTAHLRASPAALSKQSRILRSR